MKIKNICLALFAMASGFACDTQTEEKELHHEVIAIHDEVMPLMGDLKTFENQLSEKADQLALEDSAAHKDQVLRLKQASEKLEEAYEGMFVWMRQFEPDLEKLPKKERADYLKDQKEKIEKVKKDVKTALAEAEALNP